MTAIYPANHSVYHTDPDEPETDTRTVRADMIGYNAPPGFGSFHDEQRYQDIFDHDADTIPDYRYRNGGVGGNYRRHFGKTYNDQPYDDTFVVFHHNKRGFRIGVQANHKMFLIIIVVILVLFSSPGLSDVLNVLVKALLALH